jgi:AMP deaminase
MQSNFQVAVASDLFDPFAYNALPPSPHSFRMQAGVYRVFESAKSDTELFPLPGSAKDFFTDMLQLVKVGAAGPVKTYCHQRLMLLEQKFNLHVMLNADKEFLAQKTAPHRDFYNVRKVSVLVARCRQWCGCVTTMFECLKDPNS